MIPLYDSIPSRTTPLVNYAMIGACTLVFLVQLADQTDDQAALVERWGMIPARVFHPDQPITRVERAALVDPWGRVVRVVDRPRDLETPPVDPRWTLLTCIFLHGGWMHFLGIWFLLQFFQGLGTISSLQTTGVAWWAHIGGFAFGFLVAGGLRAVGETSPPVESRRPKTDHITVYRYRR
jgi:membrane associated rhomboid family serine protease